MLTLEQAVDAVTKTKPDKAVRITRRIEIGSVLHQGDVYLHCVADDHPRGKQIGRDQTQIAVGTNAGARHVIEGKVRVFEGKKLPDTVKVTNARIIPEILGPVVVVEEPASLTHPEHANHNIPAGTYQVHYQLDLRTMQRVAD